MNRYLIVALCLSTAGCLPDEELPAGETGGSRDYFIECYCQPNRDFRLTATRVLPLAGELRPDFDIPLEVTIVADQRVPLAFRVLQTGGGFVYNYWSRERLATGVDSLSLEILTPEGERVSARTVVPPAVAIDSASLGEGGATIWFRTSRAPGENYYLYVVQTFDDAGAREHASSLLDYSILPPASVVERTIAFAPAKGMTRVRLLLRRMTRQCYDYQVSLNEANSAQQGSIVTPAPLVGNIQGALGIFTCYTEDVRVLDAGM
ncbi:MAG: DUF4249 domain-containing protein [Odoribacteraceae bacterium]|jgi:hypothetical protein|nr:DUF4249 domain-containing protein [Odoribacteraceae bacterium]